MRKYVCGETHIRLTTFLQYSRVVAVVGDYSVKKVTSVGPCSAISEVNEKTLEIFTPHLGNKPRLTVTDTAYFP